MDTILIVLLVCVVIISIVYFLRYRIIGLMGVVLNMLFITSIIAVLSALFVPQIYNFFADQTLQQTGTLTKLRDIDASITSVTNAPQNALDSIIDIFNGKKNETKVDQGQPGPLEKNLYPGFVTGLTGLYRVLVIIGGIAAMITIVYLSYSTAGVSKLQHLQSEYNSLQNRVEQLEKLQRQGVTPAPAANNLNN